MESIFKRLLDAGIGVASKTSRFAEDVIHDLIERGKLSEDEGKKIIEDLVQTGSEQRQVFEKEMNSYLEKVLEKMDIPSREEYNKLSERISVLERSQPGAIQVNDIRP
jgi:polyhydroxyalkanoate synthesis regulator phasin